MVVSTPGSLWIRVLPTVVSRHAGFSGGSAAASARCEWTLDSYTSSPWEREWLEAGQERANNVCPVRPHPHMATAFARPELGTYLSTRRPQGNQRPSIKVSFPYYATVHPEQAMSPL
jgi:hypothetical protein